MASARAATISTCRRHRHEQQCVLLPLSLGMILFLFLDAGLHRCTR
ncbi:MAG: hypothetical protein MPL62_16160 [Alphaproteobacteria bacterium]|nr:hypothetical protein [Alphaproteobacteria bacterium]